MNHNGMIYSESENKMINLTNTEEFPSIPLGALEDIFNMDDISNMEYRKRNFNTYFFKGIPVPRVTSILDCIGDKDNLLGWAASFGNTREYKRAKQTILDIGSTAHEAIEAYLLKPDAEYDIINQFTNDEIGEGAKTAFKSFVNWKRKLEFQGYYIENVIAVECPMICPYFGGTFDAVVTINGANYVIDFKTSRKLQPYNLVQICIYFWMINNGYCEKVNHVHGIGLIRCDKYDATKNNDYFLNSFIPQQNEIIQSSINTFGAYCNAYYHYLNQNKNYASGRMLNAKLYNVLGDG